MLDRMQEPVTDLVFTRDGLATFIDAAPNQASFASVESHCGRQDAAGKRTAALRGRNNPAAAARLQPTSSWNAAMAGLAQIELGHPNEAIPLLEAALLLPDRNLSHHLARVALAKIKR